MPLPDAEARRALIEGKLKQGARYEISEEQMVELMDHTEGYSCADLQFIVKEAAMAPIRELSSEVLMMLKDTIEIRPLTLEDFKKVLKENQPSVSKETIN
jgi:SpoVK/Ycf46/Vps4 family AAA+-type ATPase